MCNLQVTAEIIQMKQQLECSQSNMFTNGLSM